MKDMAARIATLEAEALIFREAITALFATHPDPAALRKEFVATAGALIAQAEGSLISEEALSTARSLHDALLLELRDVSPPAP